MLKCNCTCKQFFLSYIYNLNIFVNFQCIFEYAYSNTKPWFCLLNFFKELFRASWHFYIKGTKKSYKNWLSYYA